MAGANLKYAGEAVFLVGAAYRLLHWALGAVDEGDVAPNAFTAAIRRRQPVPSIIADAAAEPSMAPITDGHGNTIGAVMMHSVQESQDSQALPGPGDPAIFPPAIWDALTPDQRVKLMESLMKQRARP